MKQEPSIHATFLDHKEFDICLGSKTLNNKFTETLRGYRIYYLKILKITAVYSDKSFLRTQVDI